MPIESVLFLCLVIGALLVFASALIYAERVSRQVPTENAPAREHSEKLPPASRPAEIENRKKAA
jgi:hypothetical protein